MKTRLCAGLLVAALFLSGCDHHKAVSHAAPAPRGDSDLTGVPPQPIDSMKTPPRATLVALPGHPIPANLPPAPRTPPVARPAGLPPQETVVQSTATPLPIPPSSDTMAATSPSSDSTPPPSRSPASSSTVSADTASDTPGAVGAGTAQAAPAPTMPETTGTESSENSEVAVIQTAMGRIVIELDDFAAPKTCKNFRQLISDGFYNNTVFHRVIPNFIIQGGDPKSKTSAADRNSYGLGSPGYTLPPEIALKHDRGAVAMARLPDSLNPRRESNGSQFYICLAACPNLDDQYTVFGHVIQGLDVAEKIAAQPRDERDNPLKRIEMSVSLVPKDQAMANVSAANP